MGALGNTQIDWNLLVSGTGVIIVVTMSYLAGRVHQYYKQGREREQAFSDGYDKATRSLFTLAQQTQPVTVQTPAEPEVPKPIKAAVAPVAPSPKHAAAGKPSTMQQTAPPTAWEKYHGAPH